MFINFSRGIFLSLIPNRANHTQIHRKMQEASEAINTTIGMPATDRHPLGPLLAAAAANAQPLVDNYNPASIGDLNVNFMTSNGDIEVNMNLSKLEIEMN